MKLIIIDETIREGMQHRGIVFSGEQRKKMAAFQETLGVDICQAGYPPAHASEADNVKMVADLASQERFTLKTAGMGRAIKKDAALLASTGIKDFHLHAHLPLDSSDHDRCRFFSQLGQCIGEIRKTTPGAKISLAMLDIGKTSPDLLEKSADILINQLGVDILSLPDTSGMLAPNQIYDCISPAALLTRESATRISIHCHNDMGMAQANTILGVFAGATVVETSVLGIGERNGIADLFTTGKILKDQGFLINLDTDNSDTFQEYYAYVNQICRDQTGDPLLTYNTPFFGEAVNTHVAGTHGCTPFGLSEKESYFLTPLCGRHLVKKYLDKENISYPEDSLGPITEDIKDKSALLGRRLKKNEIFSIASSFCRGN